MEIKNWVILIFSLIFFILIVNFLRTIFGTDKKEFSQDRIYVDYSTYQKPKAYKPGKSYQVAHTPQYYEQAQLANARLSQGRESFSAGLFQSGMKTIFDQVPPDINKDKPGNNPRYQEYLKLGNEQIEGLVQAKLWFSQKNYRQALLEFSQIKEKLHPNDLQHRMQVFDLLAESYFQIKNKDKYAEFKVKRIEVLRSIKDLVRQTFPQGGTDDSQEWISSEEATQNLLRVRTFAARDLSGAEQEMVIRRAEYDLEVARRINR